MAGMMYICIRTHLPTFVAFCFAEPSDKATKQNDICTAAVTALGPSTSKEKAKGGV
jgi:hypothetical protein